ncbi:MAG: zinc ABC transporter substrate-binding protein [Mesorhizobium sp.]
MRRLLTALAAGLTLAFAVPARAAELEVVASFSIIADFARAVGGERVHVTMLVGPDGDAHVYQPQPADAAALARADLVLVNGLAFEGFLARLAEASGGRARIATLSEGVETIPMGDGDGHATHGDGNADPHAFQSVPNARIYVRNVAEAFCAADAQGCGSYRANAAAYDKRLDGLDREIRAAVAQIPPEKRVVITSHDAFGYLAHEYGITFLAPEGVSTEAEASAADVARLIRQVRDSHAAALFVENVTDPRLIEQIGRETGLTVGGTLYSDALSPAGGPAASYLEMMRHNIATIRGAVLGS